MQDLPGSPASSTNSSDLVLCSADAAATTPHTGVRSPGRSRTAIAALTARNVIGLLSASHPCRSMAGNNIPTVRQSPKERLLAVVAYLVCLDLCEGIPHRPTFTSGCRPDDT